MTTNQTPAPVSLEAVAEAVHRGRFPDGREPTPFADEDESGRNYCERIARSVLALPQPAPEQRADAGGEVERLREAAEAVCAEADNMTMTMRRRAIFNTLKAALNTQPAPVEAEHSSLRAAPYAPGGEVDSSREDGTPTAERVVLERAGHTGAADITQALMGPHEWGYRCITDGTFIEDSVPFAAAELITHLRDAAAKAVSVAGMFRTNLRVLRGEKGVKAWDGSFVEREFQALAAAPEAPAPLGIGSARNGAEGDCEATTRPPSDPQRAGEGVDGDRLGELATRFSSGQIIGQTPYAYEMATVLRRAADRLSALAPGGLADVLVMTGCKDRAELEDMANIGRSFMERMADLIKQPGPFHGWSPADDPAELVTDMQNALDEALRAEASDPQRAGEGGEVTEFLHGVVAAMHGEGPFWPDGSQSDQVTIDLMGVEALRILALAPGGQAGGVGAAVAATLATVSLGAGLSVYDENGRYLPPRLARAIHGLTDALSPAKAPGPGEDGGV